MTPAPLDYAPPPRLRSGARAVLLAIVLALILGALGYAEYSYFIRPQRSLSKRAGTDMRYLGAGLLEFERVHGRLPTQTEGLDALMNPPALNGRAAGPYLPSLRRDPWGRPYVYYASTPEDSTGRRWRLLSVGPDGNEGTSDDVVYPD